MFFLQTPWQLRVRKYYISKNAETRSAQIEERLLVIGEEWFRSGDPDVERCRDYLQPMPPGDDKCVGSDEGEPVIS